MKTHKLIDWYNELKPTRADEVKLDFAVELNAAIENMGISRQEFAKLVGVSGARIAKALRGDSNLTIESMDKLATAAGRDIHIHLAQKGAKVRVLNVISSPKNSMQSTNLRGTYVTATNTVAQRNHMRDEDLIAL